MIDNTPKLLADQAIVMGWFVTAALVLGAKVTTLDRDYDGVQIAFAPVETTPHDMVLGRVRSKAVKVQLAPIVLTEEAVVAAIARLEQAKLVSRIDANDSVIEFMVNVESLFKIAPSRVQ